jgi:hypothetical protein
MRKVLYSQFSSRIALKTSTALPPTFKWMRRSFIKLMINRFQSQDIYLAWRTYRNVELAHCPEVL